MLRALWVTRGKQQPLEVLAGLGIPQPVLSAVLSWARVQLGGQKEDFKDGGITLLLSRLPWDLDPFEIHLWCDCEMTGWGESVSSLASHPEDS